MSNLQVIEGLISYIRGHLEAAREYQNYSLSEIEKNALVREAIERKLYVIAQAVIDLAEATVAYKGLRRPTTLREALHILGEAGILPAEFLERFIGIVGFRNALAHDYKDLRIDVIYDVLRNKLTEVKEFIAYIEKVTGL